MESGSASESRVARPAGRIVAPALAVAALLVALLLLLLAAQAHAAAITPNTTADELNSDGDCSLREAIQAANSDAAVDSCAAGSGADRVNLAAGSYPLAIPGAGEDTNVTGDLDITDDLTISGLGASATMIDGAGLDRVLHSNPDIVIGPVGGIDPNFVGTARLEISHLTVRGGSTPGSGFPEGLGGGILHFGEALIVDNSTLSGNTASFVGGGIYAGSPNGTLTVSSSTVDGNSSPQEGGGIAMDFSGPLTIDNSTVSGNSGSGISNGAALMNLNDTTVSSNSSGGIRGGGGDMTLNRSSVKGNRGFGIFNGSGATAVLNHSTVSGTDFGAFDPSISGDGIITGNDSTEILTNSTVSGNSGDGIDNHSGPATLTNSTVSGNSGSGILLRPHGPTDPGSPASASVKNTIVANSGSGDCSGTLTSAGHNLIEGTSGCSIAGDTTGNIIGVDPLLGPLQDNGGPTETHLPLTSSPVIDAGSPDCPLPATDQRGIARPQGAACDIGAVEVVLNSPPDCSSVSVNPNGLWPPNHKLRLVALAGATDSDGDTVTLTITTVTQDEPLNGLGDGDTSPDARAATQSSKALLRAERSGHRDGRVYRVSFTGSDSKGGSCSGVVTVGVPKNVGSGSVIDSAPPSFDSFGP